MHLFRLAVLAALLAPGLAEAGSLGFSFDQMPGSVFAPGQIGAVDPLSIFNGPRVPVRTDNSDLAGARASAAAEQLHQRMIVPVNPQTGLLCPPPATSLQPCPPL